MQTWLYRFIFAITFWSLGFGVLNVAEAGAPAVSPLTCPELFATTNITDASNAIDQQLYDAYIEEFELTGVRLRDPAHTTNEELLAAVEVLNTQASDKLKEPNTSSITPALQSGDARFQNALDKWLIEWKNQKKFSARYIDRQIEKLLLILDRRTVATKAKDWVRKWGPEKIKSSWNKLPSTAFRERLQGQLLKHGLRRVLQAQGLLDETSNRARFDRWYSKNHFRVRSILAAAFTIPALLHALPPGYLPHSNHAEQVLESPAVLDKILDEGFDSALPKLKKYLDGDSRWRQRYNMIAKTYTTIALLAILSVIPHEVNQAKIQRSQQQKTEFINSVNKMTAPLQAKLEADRLFDRYVESLHEKGIEIDLAAPELQGIRDSMRSAFEKTMGSLP
jgi:hypothetical protein